MLRWTKARPVNFDNETTFYEVASHPTSPNEVGHVILLCKKLDQEGNASYIFYDPNVGRAVFKSHEDFKKFIDDYFKRSLRMGLRGFYEKKDFSLRTLNVKAIKSYVDQTELRYAGVELHNQPLSAEKL